ncbi:hypothetical protein A1507_19845 [Methylomonas koyamae]|uniref:DUF7210 domain-containing protein n=1 Tax=Methylomonas koyamae TaxID=702114 RepID=A0A177N2T9_9GAMM|nr:hypothetical protein [Methylomonas koyamae]OAI11783.1 hypothetical protein A1507_19845 [Methylomonas koyamae]
MKPYLCNDPIKHDGDEYAVDESIELDDKAAKPLLAAGAIRLDTEALLAAQAEVVSAAKREVKPNAKPQGKTKPPVIPPDAGEQTGGAGAGDGQGDNSGEGDKGEQEKTE